MSEELKLFDDSELEAQHHETIFDACLLLEVGHPVAERALVHLEAQLPEWMVWVRRL